jgi:gliding motility-associated-like protein
MKLLKLILLYIFVCCYSVSATAQSITVDDAYTAQNLVDLLTNNSTCATTSSASVSGDSFSGTKNSYAYFSAGTSSFPFSEGVLLSTWSSDNSVGPFIRDNGGGDTSWLGDVDLEEALGITNTKNATVLEFDFVPFTNFISFDYIFASNEYQDYFPCQFSDGFAFLIKENGGSAAYKNLAVLPDGTTTVSSQNVHPFIPTFTKENGTTENGCAALNEEYFGQSNTATTNSSPINYSGQTVALTAQTSVIAGNSYHIKLVIADHRNVNYDSAVFLKAGSFVSKVDLGTDRLLSTNSGFCFGQTYVIDTELSSSYTYKWFRDNVLLAAEINPSYTVTDAGTYRVEINLNPSTCIATSQIKVEYTPEIVLNDQTMVQCDENGSERAIFDLTKMDNAIKNNDSSLSDVVYYESLSDAKAAINPIANPENYNNTSTDQIVYARVSNSYGCSNYAEVKLQISNNTVAPQNPVATCDGDTSQDGLYQFDLNFQVSPQVLQGLPPGLTVEYYLNQTHATLQNEVLPNLFNNTVANQQTIYARVVNGADCYDITPITLIVSTFSPLNFEEENVSLCSENAINLSVAAGYSTYLWNTGATSNTITVSSAGTYSVKVTNENGCEATKTFNVNPSGIATITGAQVNDFSGNQNSVLIEYTGIGNYEFSLDESYFQDDPKFEGLGPGTYSAYARDKNGCGLSAPFLIYVLDYPRFFTPNADGYNDTWSIKNINLLPKSTVTIYDRYGKLLKQVSSSDIEWDGVFNGSLLPSDDYWFSLNFDDGKVIKGHFTLKR